jgi:hypothetical protein
MPMPMLMNMLHGNKTFLFFISIPMLFLSFPHVMMCTRTYMLTLTHELESLG